MSVLKVRKSIQVKINFNVPVGHVKLLSMFLMIIHLLKEFCFMSFMLLAI